MGTGLLQQTHENVRVALIRHNYHSLRLTVRYVRDELLRCVDLRVVCLKIIIEAKISCI